MKKLFTFVLISSSFYAIPSRADVTVSSGTKIYYSDQVPINFFSDSSGIGLGHGYTFTQDYECSSNVTSNTMNSGIIMNQACMYEIIKSGFTSNISTNTSNISTNTSNISTNTSNISTNTSNISTNKANIKNLGEGVAGSTALTAALSALPQTSKESKLSCGVGTGAYSSRYAVGFGCASKVNERVDINAGGSYVFGGSKSYGGGTLDSGVIKAGFVFKLGELNKSTQISMKDKKVMKTKILSLEENNNKIISQNKDLKQQNKSIISKNQNLENKVFTLMARLERLEKIALSETTSKDVAIYKLK